MLNFAPAKINIGLFVTEKRSDGYHNIETVLYPINLYDVVEISVADKFSFHADGKPIPDNMENLCEKAYKLLKSDFDLRPVRIDLLKNIPIGAGLGGGSSDAALVLRMLDSMHDLNLSVDQLEAYASRLGADCPFFIEAAPVFASGTGTDLEKISLDLSDFYIVVVQPKVHISTREAYQSITPQTPTLELRQAIQLPIQEWKFQIVNDFELGVFRNHPVIEQIKHRLYEEGAIYASMSGSGSAVYGVFEEKIRLDSFESLGKVYYPVDL